MSKKQILFIKLEIAKFIKVIKKIRYLIKVFYNQVIIKINYLSIFDIM